MSDWRKGGSRSSIPALEENGHGSVLDRRRGGGGQQVVPGPLFAVFYFNILVQFSPPLLPLFAALIHATIFTIILPLFVPLSLNPLAGVETKPFFVDLLVFLVLLGFPSFP